VSLPQRLRTELDGYGRILVLGIRPEEVLSEEAAAGHENAFPIDVNVVEPLGDITYLYTDVDEGETTISVSRNTELEPGDRIQVAFPAEEIHVFDDATGEALVNRGRAVGADRSTVDGRQSDTSEA